MARVINPIGTGGGGGGLVPTIRATAPVGSTVSCDGQTKVVGAEGYVDFVVSAEPVNILPDGVQGLESIESIGTQYVDTLIPQTTTVGFDTKFSITSSGYWQDIVGCDDSVSYALGLTADATLSQGMRIWYGNSSSSWIRISDVVIGKAYEVSVNHPLGKYNINEASGDRSFTYSSNVTYKAFARKGKSGDYFAKCKMYYLNMFDNGNQRRRFIPCTYNNQVGMWDTVSNSFFGNQGTGLFIAGEPKEWVDYPTYTVTVNGISKTVTIEGVELRTVSF